MFKISTFIKNLGGIEQSFWNVCCISCSEIVVGHIIGFKRHVNTVKEKKQRDRNKTRQIITIVIICGNDDGEMMMK